MRELRRRIDEMEEISNASERVKTLVKDVLVARAELMLERAVLPTKLSVRIVPNCPSIQEFVEYVRLVNRFLGNEGAARIFGMELTLFQREWHLGDSPSWFDIQ